MKLNKNWWKQVFFCVPYPHLVIVHAIYGTIAAAVLTQQSSLSVGLHGAATGILVGLVAFLVLKVLRKL